MNRLDPCSHLLILADSTVPTFWTAESARIENQSTTSLRRTQLPVQEKAPSGDIPKGARSSDENRYLRIRMKVVFENTPSTPLDVTIVAKA